LTQPIEAGVKVVTNWVIGRLADRRFASLEDLNEAIAAEVEAINDRIPFRGQKTSRRELFTEHEQTELIALPEVHWQPVIWKKSKVNRDYHVGIATVKYSVPYTFAGQHVDVKITGPTWQIGLVGTAGPASWYRHSGDPEPARA
jgi:hypothetical protein